MKAFNPWAYIRPLAVSMRLDAFDMVRMQCAYERKVDFDLSGSGVPSLGLGDLIEDDSTAGDLLASVQNYPPSGGSDELRAKIAALYPGASVDDVLVTNGATEANFMAAWRLLEKGDEIIVMVPGYLQTWNLALSWGAKVRALPLREDLEWQFDTEELKAIMNDKTRAIHICNPNNPTGAVMADEQRRALLDCARDAGAWVLSDEVYVGAERSGHETLSIWGDYDRVLVSNGLCKSYGLPGLRIGWLVGTPDMLSEMTTYHDYLTLTHSMPCDILARLALESERRQRLLGCNQEVVRKGHELMEGWMRSNDPAFYYTPPQAGPMCFIRYASDVGSLEVGDRLREEQSVLVVPGIQMGMEGYLRIGTGLPPDVLLPALDRINACLHSMG